MTFRQVVTISLLLLASLAFAAFLVTQYSQTLLPSETYSTLFLFVGIVLAAATFLAAFKDIIELVEKFRAIEHASAPAKDKTSQRDRQTMLQLVKNTWVKGVLEKSLYHEMLIHLGMEERPGAVEHPWDMTVQTPDQPNRPLPSGTQLVEVFDKSNGALLILGEPGSGKTTMLIELAHDMIKRAEQYSDQPISVVFNLSSWSNPQQPIADWLMAELVTKYFIPKKVAAAWLEQNELLPLLDGLDEVDVARQEACVQAINAFRSEHGLTPLVVCSRIADYEALSSRLTLRGAVLLQPLKHLQVNQYLQNAGAAFTALHNAWQRDTTLQHLARSPLMLSIMMLAYQDVDAQALHEGGSESIEQRRKRIFGVYVERMFQRLGRTSKTEYTKEEALHWLAWLARKMMEHSQSMFLLERVNSSWLDTRTQQRLHIVFLVLVCVLVCGLSAGAFFGLIGALFWGLLGGLFAWVRFGAVLIGLAEPSEILTWSWTEARRAVDRGIKRDLGLGTISGSVSGLITVLVAGRDIQLLYGLLVGMLIGLVGGLVFGLVIGLALGLIDLIQGGFKVARIEMYTTPNQGIRRSMKNAIIMGLVWGLVVQLFFGLILSLSFVMMLVWPSGSVGLQSWWPFVFLFWGGLLGIEMGAMNYGGIDVLQHYILRFILFRSHSMPWDYVHFLNYSADRIFLRKIGGGYIFVHRLLQEYFAAMNITTPNANK